MNLESYQSAGRGGAGNHFSQGQIEALKQNAPEVVQVQSS